MFFLRKFQITHDILSELRYQIEYIQTENISSRVNCLGVTVHPYHMSLKGGTCVVCNKKTYLLSTTHVNIVQG